jgi:hypothetical protein
MDATQLDGSELGIGATGGGSGIEPLDDEKRAVRLTPQREKRAGTLSVRKRT